MTRKSEKIANLSISILEPPSIQMTCSTTNFRLESFSPNINDTNYLHLPPPTPKFSLKTENMCYTDIPMYAMAIATNKNTTPIRDCSVTGTAFFESRDIGRFSSTTIGLTDFIIQPNEQVFIPFQLKIPHLISSVSSRTKVVRSQSCFNTEIGSNQKMNLPTKTILISSFFHFKANENNQKMQINILEKIDVQNSVALSYKISSPFSNSRRNSLFQVVLTNNLPILIRNAEAKTINPKPNSPVPTLPIVHNSANTSEMDNLNKKKTNRIIKLGDSIDPGETVSGYVSYAEAFNSIEIYFLLPYCTFCCFSEPILASYGASPRIDGQNSNKQQSQQNFSRGSSTVIETKKSPSVSAFDNRSNIPLSQASSSQKFHKNLAVPHPQPPATPPKPVQIPNLSFQANLNKLPKAVQTLRPFSVQIQIINTNKSSTVNKGEANDKNSINGVISIGESESIYLFGNNDLTFPNILPGQSYSVTVGLIALKQGNFTFPKIFVRLNNFKNTEIDFETGIIAIGCNE